jgi:hypothetical protein
MGSWLCFATPEHGIACKPVMRRIREAEGYVSVRRLNFNPVVTGSKIA